MFCGGSRMCVDLQTNDTCRLFKKGGAKKKTAKLKLSQKSYRKETIVRLDYRTTVLISGRQRKVEFECGEGSIEGSTDFG